MYRFGNNFFVLKNILSDWLSFYQVLMVGSLRELPKYGKKSNICIQKYHFWFSAINEAHHRFTESVFLV